MFCNSCGHANPDTARFCSTCGEGMSQEPASRVEQTVVARTTPTSIDTEPKATAPSSSSSGARPFDEEAWRTYVGPRNTNFYLPRFRAFAAGGSAAGWHWPAFLATSYWLLYRKMWLYAVGYWTIPYLLVLASVALIAGTGAENEVVHWLLVAELVLLYFVLPPLFASRIYFRHASKQMAALQISLKSRDAFLGGAHAKGGTSNVALLLIIVFGLLFVVGILAAVALPAYQDYTMRAKVSEAVRYGNSAAAGVYTHWRSTERFPTSISDLPDLLPKPQSVHAADLSPTDGSVLLWISGDAGQITFTPMNDGTVACKAKLKRAAWAPAICR